jgi:anaerobic magnesium-protoporphyrin IX monomethyl ester cyclase
MTQLKQRFRPDHVWFADDIFGFRTDWVDEFAQHLRESDGQVPFTIQTRADLIGERMAQALKRAGCSEAWIGAESGSQKVLDAMNKGTTVEEILTARQRFKAVGIRVGFFIQLGYLGEQLEDLLATRQLVSAACPDDIGVSVSYPLPGTKFYELVRQQLHGKTHWQDSADLAMMFKGTYTSEFYREVRNLLHEQVAIDQATRLHNSADARQARHVLEHRWTQLLSGEHRFRSAGGAMAAAV